MNPPRHFILDLDGVVYRGNQVIAGAPAFFQQAAARGCRWLFVSNNSTRTPAEFATKLTGMGIPTPPERVVTSAEVTAEYVRDQLAVELGRPPRLLVVGEEGLRSLLTQAGAVVVDWLPSPSQSPVGHGMAVDAVIAGLDTQFTFSKLRVACYWIRRGARFIGTNPDRTFPYPDGIGPGAGSILAALQACTDVEPLVMGKPRPPILQAALRRLGRTDDVWVIGDRLDTDIAGANAIGLPSCLVLTGVTSRGQVEKVEELPAAWRPTRIADSLPALAAELWGGW